MTITAVLMLLLAVVVVVKDLRDRGSPTGAAMTMLVSASALCFGVSGK